MWHGYYLSEKGAKPIGLVSFGGGGAMSWRMASMISAMGVLESKTGSQTTLREIIEKSNANKNGGQSTCIPTPYIRVWHFSGPSRCAHRRESRPFDGVWL